MRGHPLDGVVAVRAFVAERYPVAGRVVAAANVLQHDDVTVVGEIARVGDVDRMLVVVRRPCEHRRVGTGVGTAGRKVDVGAEFDAVAHRDLHVPPLPTVTERPHRSLNVVPV